MIFTTNFNEEFFNIVFKIVSYYSLRPPFLSLFFMDCSCLFIQQAKEYKRLKNCSKLA